MSITSSNRSAATAASLEGISRPLGIILTMEQAMALGGVGGFNAFLPIVAGNPGKGAAGKKDVETKQKDGWKSFSDSQLARAVELMISPSDLSIREVAQAILETLDYTPVEVKEHLKSQSYLNDGFVFDALNSNEPAIIRSGKKQFDFPYCTWNSEVKSFRRHAPQKTKKRKAIIRTISESMALHYLVNNGRYGSSKHPRFLCTRDFLSKEWGVGVNVVRTTLKNLELMGCISVKTTNKGTIVTILRRSL